MPRWWIHRRRASASFSSIELMRDVVASDPQKALFRLPRRVGGHVPGISPPALPAETPAIDALFAERRQALDARRQLRRLQDAQAAAPHRLGVRQLVRGRELLGKLLRAG